MSEILNKIKTASDSELDDLINSLSSEIKESKELDTLGYNFELMQKGVENYNRELEEYMALAEADSQIKYGLPFGTPDYGQAGLSEDQKFDLMQDFRPSKTTSLQLLGLNSNEVDGLANQAYNLMYGAASNMDPNMTKDYVQSVIQTFNPNSTIEMAYANELPPEAIADINRIQELQGSGFNVNVDDDLLLYRKDGSNWSVVNEPGFSKGDLGYFGKDIVGVLVEIPAYASGGPAGAGAVAAVVESTAQTLAYVANQNMRGEDVTFDGFQEVFLNSLPDAVIAGASTAILTRLSDAVFRYVMAGFGRKQFALSSKEIAEGEKAISANQGNIDKLNEINQQIQKVTGDPDKKIVLSTGEATGDFNVIRRENTVEEITELAPKYNQAYKNKIDKSQDAVESYSKDLLETDSASRTSVVSELGKDIQEGVSGGVEKEAQKILDSYTLDFANVTKIYDLVNKTTDQGADLLDDFGFIQKVFQDQNKIIQGELKTIEDSVTNILNKYGPDVTDNLVKLSTFQKTLKQIDANRSFLNKLEPGTSEHTLFKNFLEFTKDGRKVKNLTLQETQQLIQYIDALSGDAFSSALKGVPDAKKGEFKQLLFALRTDLKRSLKKNLKGDADAIFDAYENMKNIRRDFDNNVVNQLFQKSNSGKLKLSDGSIINHVLNDARFSSEMASILNQGPNFAKKAAFEQSIIDDYYKNVLNDMTLSPKELAKKAETWLNNNKYVDNFFTGENRIILKRMKSPIEFKRLNDLAQKKSDNALRAVKTEFDGILGLDPANYLDFFSKNPTSFNRVITLIKSSDPVLGKSIEKQTKEFFLKDFFESTSFYDPKAGMRTFNGEKLLEFLKVNNNKEMLKNIFGKEKGDEFIKIFYDIGDVYNNFQKKLSVKEQEPQIIRAALDVLFGPLNRKRTMLRGIKKAAKLLGSEEYLDTMLDVDLYQKLLKEQEFLNPKATVFAAKAIETEAGPPDEESNVQKLQNIVKESGANLYEKGTNLLK